MKKFARFILFALLALAIILVFIFALFLTQRTDTQHAKFADGSYYEIRQPNGWCFDSNSFAGWLELKFSGVSSVRMLEPGDCKLFIPTRETETSNFNMIAFASVEKPAREAGPCRNQQIAISPIEAVGGKVFYCEVAHKKDQKKNLVNFIYPVNTHKSLVVFMETRLFIQKQKEIIPVLHSLRYFK